MENYKTTFTIKRLWWILSISMLVMFTLLLLFGREIYHKAPPIPSRVETTTGQLIYTQQDIQKGQNIWQSIGGMQQGIHLGTRRLFSARLECGLVTPRSTRFISPAD